MPATASPLPHAAVVGRLRAAGCVFAEDEADVLFAAAQTPVELGAMVARRAAGLPLEQVVGWAEFCGLRIAVEPEVFVPRRRTEFLVACAAALLDATHPVVIDLCCGSGALGLALSAVLGGAGAGLVELHASDIHPAAVRCARRNVGASGAVYEGDLFDPLPVSLRGRVDVLLANVPYVPTDAIGLLPSEARDHEPRVTLDGGMDGQDVMRRVLADAPQWLAPGGHVVIESTERQVAQALEAATRAGLIPQVARSGDLGATVIIGIQPR